MRNIRNLSLSVKLVTVMGIFILFIFFFMIMLNLKQLYTISLEEGELTAHNAGQEYATMLRTKLVEIQSKLETMGDTLQAAKLNNKWTREDIVLWLHDALEEHTDLLGIYTAWEPDAFDHNDKGNIRKNPYDDGTGRFVPYLARAQDKIVPEPLKGYEVPGEGDYYQIPKKTKQLTYIDPYLYNVAGTESLMMSVVQPILDENGRFLGVVGADLSLADLQKEAENFKPLGGYVSLITDEGVYAVNPNDPESILKPFGDQPEKEALWQKVMKGETTAGYTLNSANKEVLRAFESIVMPGTTDNTWYTSTVVERSVILSSFTENRRDSLIIGIFSMVLLGGILITMIRRMVIRPVQALGGKLQLMAEGDFTQHLEVKSNDELGRMAGNFNVMAEKLRGMLGLVADTAMAVGAASQQLTASAGESSKAAENIAESIQGVAEGAVSQRQQAGETAVAVTEMAKGVQRIAESSVSVSSSVSDVTVQTEQGNLRIREAVSQMGQVQDAVKETGEAIDRLNQRSEEIGSMIGMITNISTQTNLLALNASIEAARVGEQGRGFAVVAMEVRKLAEQTKEAAEQVTHLVGDFRSDTEKAARSMAAGYAQVNSGVLSVRESGQVFHAIMAEMGSVNDQIQDVSASAEQMTASSQQIAASVDQLADIASEASGNSHQVAAASEEQLASMEEIAASAESLSKMVEDLMDRLSHFKIG
ncbi:methyl-accepting chemotaxis protein [Paenibacillus nasutitermitis]|uniref:Methyl-accepting chemotaxis protein n=1 Tax=Paenibacillus nasutitermitis TaxID=1652958 RepID=A0A916ZEZ4_9BACL|nr:methyl-accepting chemotaxis protein [Paenibacillus nasutitermitis]GGD93269.1 hypothetical protein GCM10010911_59850 [Paenibacillus nasutitermitis]